LRDLIPGYRAGVYLTDANRQNTLLVGNRIGSLDTRKISKLRTQFHVTTSATLDLAEPMEFVGDTIAPLDY